MRVRLALRLGLRNLVRHPIRSFLLVQGIAWAVALPVFLGSVLRGTNNTAVERAQEVGTARLNIATDRSATTRPLVVADAAGVGEALTRKGHRVRAVGAVRVLGAGSLRSSAHGGDGVPATFLVTHAEEAAARGQVYATGRPPTAVGEVSLENALARSLGVDRVGGVVQLAPGGPEGVAGDLVVVGILAPRSDLALRTDDLGLTREGPFGELVESLLAALGAPRFEDGWKRTGACARLAPAASTTDEVDWLFVGVDPSDTPVAADDASTWLSEHGAAPLVLTNMLWPALAEGVVERFLVLFEALVACCLALGVVVVSCLLLYSVSRRTAEFGVRRAEGATSVDIAAMVLVEATSLGLVAGGVGVPLGIGLAKVRVGLGPYTMMSVEFPPQIAFWAVALGVAAGVVSGLVPAWRAARMPPVEALRRPS